MEIHFKAIFKMLDHCVNAVIANFLSRSRKRPITGEMLQKVNTCPGSATVTSRSQTMTTIGRGNRHKATHRK